MQFRIRLQSDDPLPHLLNLLWVQDPVRRLSAAVHPGRAPARLNRRIFEMGRFAFRISPETISICASVGVRHEPGSFRHWARTGVAGRRSQAKQGNGKNECCRNRKCFHRCESGKEEEKEPVDQMASAARSRWWKWISAGSLRPYTTSACRPLMNARCIFSPSAKSSSFTVRTARS